ncbi:hypothetical protein ANCDUO_13619 [Ancylostoma duodenale]|uniref:Uncharacterized protein n=1 Tax=Ancylostoma duodenale TaxID=51022 RepID=A0A0C2D2E2_9BILA|nr:hypothetical protein ANCDUO_13619 [Ancylostoma duodenale]
MESLGDIIHDRMHNQLCKVMAGVIFYLLITDSNWIVCNSIVVVVPMLLLYVYPDERPPAENMRVFWYDIFRIGTVSTLRFDSFRISAFIISAYDRMLEAFPFYYVGKLLALLFLLVEPSCLNERLKKLLNIKPEPNEEGSTIDK